MHFVFCLRALKYCSELCGLDCVPKGHVGVVRVHEIRMLGQHASQPATLGSRHDASCSKGHVSRDSISTSVRMVPCFAALAASSSRCALLEENPGEAGIRSVVCASEVTSVVAVSMLVGFRWSLLMRRAFFFFSWFGCVWWVTDAWNSAKMLLYRHLYRHDHRRSVSCCLHCSSFQ